MKNVKCFIPAIMGTCVSLIGLIIYLSTSKDIEGIKCIQFIAVPLVLCLLIGLNMTKKIHIPILFHYVLLIHLIMALVLGAGFDFYDKIASWDMLLHGYFGFVASLFVFIVLLNYNGEKIKSSLFFLIIFFVTMGFAGMWEIFEFIMDRILDGDIQRIQESLSQGHTPIYDTMMDMIITIAGIVCFYFLVIIDKFFDFKCIKIIYYDIQGYKCNDLK